MNNAVPGVLTPTLGQAVWAAGFAQSLANHGLFSLHAQDIGLPASAALAFGLSGAWPMSVLIRLGVPGADAYSATIAMWLLIALFSARRIALRLGSGEGAALLGAVIWASQPMIWAHADYSMLSLGMALLPFYFLMVLRLLDPAVARWKAALSYLAAAIIAVFMDGYTFIMFATGASVTIAYRLLLRLEPRTTLLRIAVPVHFGSFALAYWLYTRYVGTTQFAHVPLDFFRGWGLDLSFLVVPSKGILWLPDFLGLSEHRTTNLFYGDNSTWDTTFALPLLLAVGGIGLVVRRRRLLVWGLIAGAVLSFYLALGPSLKVHSIKPQGVHNQNAVTLEPMMPAGQALAPTGSAWVSENLPGFNAMRAPYRWAALGLFVTWCLFMLQLPWLRGQLFGCGILVLLLLFNLPHPLAHLRVGAQARAMFFQMDREFAIPLGQALHSNEVVAFVPWGNDFLANYLAPRAKVRTFNVGGDKNVERAQLGWPAEFLAAGPGWVPGIATDPLALMLLKKQADVLVFPYVDLLWAANAWPCIGSERVSAWIGQRTDAGVEAAALCPPAIRQQRRAVLDRLSKLPFLKVEDGGWFATVRLVPPDQMSSAWDSWAGDVDYPLLPQAGLLSTQRMLADGWYPVELGHVWSGAQANLQLPRPRECRESHCEFQIMMGVFAASTTRPVRVSLKRTCHGGEWSETHLSTTADLQTYSVPVCSEDNWQTVSVEVDKPDSPQRLYGSDDVRVLGVYLKRIEWREVN
ncbi:hypothetical protein KW851_02480 [Pseudomonas sp. PDM33]|uniref:hypothetical protein n=1 Tax=unclassified Pseudomonas TaxID=196821 RepID=UPI0012E04BB2|nr:MULTISPECIES: hypothetical protein [unclassified Pseudomonas]MBV7581666.1 hypothetical protein [Pseudomonas sp. PDM33]